MQVTAVALENKLRLTLTRRAEGRILIRHFDVHFLLCGLRLVG